VRRSLAADQVGVQDYPGDRLFVCFFSFQREMLLRWALLARWLHYAICTGSLWAVCSPVLELLSLGLLPGPVKFRKWTIRAGEDLQIRSIDLSSRLQICWSGCRRRWFVAPSC
jgi:hypothetical protein